MTSTLTMVGTRKGLWVGTLGRGPHGRGRGRGPHFAMEGVYSVLIDRRGDAPRLFAGCSSSWFGPQVRRSDDLGETWEETPNGAIRFPEDASPTAPRPWPASGSSSRVAEDGVVWAGTEPGAVFRSTDRGETFELVRGLWDHPHRTEWNEGFGGQAFHTVLPHPTDAAVGARRASRPAASTAPRTAATRGRPPTRA